MFDDKDRKDHNSELIWCNGGDVAGNAITQKYEFEDDKDEEPAINLLLYEDEVAMGAECIRKVLLITYEFRFAI